MRMQEQIEVSGSRIASLDQFRGYTIAGMILVNYLGQFGVMPETFRHHADSFSYADTIAPLFLFVVGAGFRLSFLKTRARAGAASAWRAAIRRYLIITCIGIVLYNPVDWRDWWDALVDIGLSGFLALPFIGASVAWRVGAAFAYGLVYQFLFTCTGYGAWTLAESFDGGPLGPLSWVFCLLLGTLLHDLVATGDRRRIVTGCLAWGIGLTVLGFVLHVEWPGLKAAWPFSQYAMTLPYPILATGLAFLTYVPFYVLADVWHVELPTLTPMGANPLVIYLVQYALLEIHGTVVPEDSATLAALLGFAGFYLVCYAVARHLHRSNIIIKI